MCSVIDHAWEYEPLSDEGAIRRCKRCHMEERLNAEQLLEADWDQMSGL